MKYLFLLLFSIGFSCLAQETIDNKQVVNLNQVKIGSSIQTNVRIFYSDYVYYDSFYGGYYYEDDYIYADGPDCHVFGAYEHIWQFTGKSIALGIEPQIGASFYRYLTTGYTGLNMKFYWVSRPNFRMGIASYFGYTYASQQHTRPVPMDGGMYYENKEVTTHYNQFSGDISLIPFQFILGDNDIIIESQIAVAGLNLTTINLDRQYQDQYYYGRDTEPSFYFMKFELKVGYQF